MKKLAFLILIGAAFFSCRSKQSEEVVSNVGTDSLVNKPDSAMLKTDSHYFWTSDLDPKKGLVMLRTTPIPADSLTATNMINMLNGLYPEIPLRFIRVSNDSIFLRINKSTYLTQQMGSSGADAYLAEVTYNLTELKDINFVVIMFKEGDHAAPGTYSRTDFIQIKN